MYSYVMWYQVGPNHLSSKEAFEHRSIPRIVSDSSISVISRLIILLFLIAKVQGRSYRHDSQACALTVPCHTAKEGDPFRGNAVNWLVYNPIYAQ